MLHLVTQLCPTLCDSMDCSLPGSSVHGDSTGKNIGVGCHALQGIFPTQGSIPGLLHCGQILYQLSHQGSPRIVEWVAYPFSRELPDPGIELGSPALQVYSLPTELCRKPIQGKGIPKAWITDTWSRHAWAKQLELKIWRTNAQSEALSLQFILSLIWF